MKILILGATGHIGQGVLETAMTRGCEVTAFVRDPQKLADFKGNRMIGDASNPADLQQAVSGHTAVINALSPRTLEPSTFLSDVNLRLIDAMKSAGAARLITVLSLGVLADSVDEKYVHIVNQHRRVLEQLRQTDLEWVAACPPAVTLNPRKGVYDAVANGFSGNSWEITRYDLADFLLDQIASDQFLRQPVGLTN